MKTNLFFLAILFSFAFSKVGAQCPEGDVTFIYQHEVNNFVATYPNCTHITGRLWIGEFNNWETSIFNISGLNNITTIDGALGIYNTQLKNLDGLQNLNSVGASIIIDYNDNLTSLSQLSNITLVNGRLEIGENDNLTSLEGLQNITHVQGHLRVLFNDKIESIQSLNSVEFVGDFLGINGNPLLESLTGLDNLTHVGTYIFIYENDLITTLEPIKNINPSSLSGTTRNLMIGENPNLSTCNLPNICEYLSFNPTEYPREITGNTGNCTDEQAVLAACGLGVNDVENEMANWQVHYKKENNSFLIQSKGFEIADIQVYNLNGQLLKEISQLNSSQEEISVFSPDNILIIKVISSDGKNFAKKVIVK